MREQPSRIGYKMKIANKVTFERLENLKRKAQDNEQNGSDTSDFSKGVVGIEGDTHRLSTFKGPQIVAENAGTNYISLSKSCVDTKPDRPLVSKSHQPEGDVSDDDIECLGTFPAPKRIKTLDKKDEHLDKGQSTEEHISKSNNMTSTKAILEKSSVNSASTTNEVQKDSDCISRSVEKCLKTPDVKQHVQNNVCPESLKITTSEQSSLNSSGKVFVAQPPRDRMLTYIPRGPGNYSKVPFNFEIKQEVRFIPLTKKSSRPVLIRPLGLRNLNLANKNPAANRLLLVNANNTVMNSVKPGIGTLVEPESKGQSPKQNQTDNQTGEKVFMVGNNIIKFKSITPTPSIPLTSKTPVISQSTSCTQKLSGNILPNVTTVDQGSQTDMHCWLYKNNKLYLLEEDGTLNVVPVEKASATSFKPHFPERNSPVSSIDDDSSCEDTPEPPDLPGNHLSASSNLAFEAPRFNASFDPNCASQEVRILRVSNQTAMLPTLNNINNFNISNCTLATIPSFTLQPQDSSTENKIVQPQLEPESISPPSQLQDASLRLSSFPVTPEFLLTPPTNLNLQNTSQLQESLSSHLSFPVQPEVLTTPSTNVNMQNPSQLQESSPRLLSFPMPTPPTNVNVQNQLLSNGQSYISPRAETSADLPNTQNVSMNFQDTMVNSGNDLPPFVEKAFMKIYNDIKTCLIEDNHGNIPLHQAVLNNNIIKLKSQCIVLKAIKSHLNHTNLAHETALMLAVKLAQEAGNEAVNVLVAEGADQTIADLDGLTPLHYAISHGLTTVAQILLAAGDADKAKEKFCSEGFAPLHLAVLEGHLDIINLLVKKGVDLNIKDRKSGRTPYFLAVERGNSEAAKLLMALKANMLEPNFAGVVPHLLEGKSDVKSHISSLERQMTLKKSFNLNDEHKNVVSKKKKLRKGKAINVDVQCDECGGQGRIYKEANQVQQKILDYSSLASHPNNLESQKKDVLPCINPTKSLEDYPGLLLNSPLRRDFADPNSDSLLEDTPALQVNDAMSPLDSCVLAKSSNDKICENVRKSLDSNNENNRPRVIPRVVNPKNGIQMNFNRYSPLKSYDNNLTDHSPLSSRSEQNSETLTTSISLGFSENENIMQQDQTRTNSDIANLTGSPQKTTKSDVVITESHKNVSPKPSNIQKPEAIFSGHSEAEIDDMDDEFYYETMPVNYGSAETLSMVIGDCSLLSKPESPSFITGVGGEDCSSVHEDSSSGNCEAVCSNVQLTFNTYMDDIVKYEDVKPDNNVQIMPRRASRRGQKAVRTNTNEFPGNKRKSNGLTVDLQPRHIRKGGKTRVSKHKSSDSSHLSTQECSDESSSIHLLKSSQEKIQTQPGPSFSRKSTRKSKT